MKHFPATIDSVKLYLRLLTSRDAAEFYALTNDPAIANIISFLSYPVPRSFADEWIAKNLGTSDRIYGAYGFNNRLIGTIGTHQREDGGIEIGYWVGSAYMGQGYATEMLRAIVRMIREYSPGAVVYAECLPGNAGSLKVLGKAGFTASDLPARKNGRNRLDLKTAS